MNPLSVRHEVVNFSEDGLTVEEISVIMNIPETEVVSIINDEAEYRDDLEDPDDSMDGDFDSGMASAGFGTDEDYGCYEDCGYF